MKENDQKVVLKVPRKKIKIVNHKKANTTHLEKKFWDNTPSKKTDEKPP